MHSKILQSLQNGDEDAWSLLVEECSGEIFAVTQRFKLPKEEGEDITQEIFLRLIKNGIKKYDPAKASFQTYVKTLAKNLCIDRLRKLGRTISLEDTHVGAYLQSDHAENNDIPEDTIKVLKAFLRDELTPEQRLVINLRYCEKYSYAQIAEIMNRNYNWVKNRLHRDRLKLKRTLDNRRKPFVSSNDM